MRCVSVFGATGSIGESTFDLLMQAGRPRGVSHRGPDRGANVARLAEMALALRAEVAVTADDSRPWRPARRLAGQRGSRRRRAAGDGRGRDRPADWVMSAIVGAAGLRAGTSGAAAGGDAGAGQQGKPGDGRAPADGQRRCPRRAHPAGGQRAFRDLSGPGRRGYRRGRAHHPDRLGRRLARLAAGAAGPGDRGRGAGPSELGDGPADHHRFSASMFNKALEVIETREFFGVEPDQIEVIIHPEIADPFHGRLPRRRDHGASWGARHAPCHRLCAELAGRARPCRWRGWIWPPVGTLTFRAPDLARYPALRLAREVMARARPCRGGLQRRQRGGAGSFSSPGASASWTWRRWSKPRLPEVSAEISLGKAATALEDVLAMDHLARIRARRSDGARGRKWT